MVQAEGPGSCLTQPPGSAEQEEDGRMTQEVLFEGGRREAVSRQSQAGAASPGETQPERPKDETCSGGVCPSSISWDFSPPFPLPSLQSPSAGKTSRVRTARLDFCKVTVARVGSCPQRGGPDPPHQLSL